MKTNKIQKAVGFVLYWLIFGGSAAALIGMDSEEFGTLCRAVLALECVLWSIVILVGLAVMSPDRHPGTQENAGKRMVVRDVYRLDEREPDPRKLGYVTPDEIRRAARCRRRR